ncbi:uncharacterized protein LOC131669003 [Phymastichus coffea]|uniref:uncharacterized protein LOC131669003 n=1 Tax=Phymastichus coffea TaxID=108790 RepID=UPI00273BA337|nr:uncharacterized protein LOC131669003 [Phymastichus coffea]
MDISDIGGLSSDVASEDTLESEIDALSKIITDTKDDIHKMDDNDDVFKLDNNEISFADSLQGHSAKSNKCELISDDNIALSDILDGSRELDNFISTSNVDSDLQEVLGETFETIEDSNSKNNQLANETTDHKNEEIYFPAQPSCVNNVTLLNESDNRQKSPSHSQDQPVLILEDETNHSTTRSDMHQQLIEKSESNSVVNEMDPTDCLSEFMKKDDSQNVFKEQFDAVEESDLNSLVTKSTENKSIGQTNFTQALHFPSENSDNSDVIINSKDNLEEGSAMDTEEQYIKNEIENSNIPAIEVINYAKDTNIHKMNIEMSILHQEKNTEKDEKIYKSEEIQDLNQIEITQVNKSCSTKDTAQEIITSDTKIQDSTENCQIIDEQLDKEENIENKDFKSHQKANTLDKNIHVKDINEDKNENSVISECNKLVHGNEFSKIDELKEDNSAYLENDSVSETNCNLEDKSENIKDSKDIDAIKDVYKNNDDQNSDNTKVVLEGPSSINTEIKIPIISEKIDTNVSQNNIEKDEQPILSKNEQETDFKLSLESSIELQNNSSLITQGEPKDIVILNYPISDSIVNAESTETKENLDENKIPNVIQENVSSIEQDLDSQGSISHILNEVEKDLDSGLNNVIETKEAVTKNMSNFDNSEVLNSSNQNTSSLEEKSQDSLLIINSIPDQIDNKKLTSNRKTQDITFQDSSQLSVPMQSDNFINDLYNTCMPDHTTEFGNTDMESIKESIDFENSIPVLKTGDQQLLETDALEVENIEENNDLKTAQSVLEIENQRPLELDALVNPALKLNDPNLLKKDTVEIENTERSTELENSKSLMEIKERMENIEQSSDLEKSKSDMEIENQVIEMDTLKITNIEENNVLEDPKSALEIKDQQLLTRDESESTAEFILEETEKVIDESSVEISELESAVKFLQESEQTHGSQVESTNEENSSIFVSVEESECGNASELISDLSEASLDPIAISEAEIISEAAKLENERKEKLELEKLELEKLKSASQETGEFKDVDENLLTNVESIEKSNESSETTAEDILQISINTRLTSEFLPKTGVLDERYKEPPKIEIPETSKLVELPNTALLIQKQRLDSPDRQTTSGEPKISDTPTKKDNSDKQQPECENVGSPRIILKIAKSAITECSEPRSPKSPKVRSSDSPNPEDSLSSQKLGKIKLKLSKGGHPSIIPSGDSHQEETWHADCTSSSLSPMGMKIKITKSAESSEESQKLEEVNEKLVHKVDDSKKPEAPIGMKIKLSKTGDASIVQQDNKETTQETTMGKKQDSPSLGMKIKLSKTGDASIIQQDKSEYSEDDSSRRTESPIGMKIKLSKSGDASVISSDPPESAKENIDEPIKRTDSPIGVKIKLAKNKGGSASIISTETVEELGDSSIAKAGLGMKIKLSKSGDASVVHTIKEDIHESMEQHIGMKIKLSKTGDPSIIPSVFSREYEDITQKSKHSKHKDHGIASQRSKDDSHLEMKIKLSKTGHPTIITPTDINPLKTSTIPIAKSQADHTDIISFKQSHSDVTIEPIKSQLVNNAMVDLHGKRKEITIAPVESKKTKVDTTTKQMLPDITIQPISTKKEVHQQSQKLVLESNTGSISRQQMSVINQEISITQVRSIRGGHSVMSEHRKNTLNVPTEHSAPSSADCEIIEARPELIIVNENSNSSQDVMIIEEVPPVKTPKKRGRPRRNALPAVSTFPGMDPSRDPLSLDQSGMRVQIPSQLQVQATMLQQVPPQHIIPPTGDGSERPRRTCRNQKSYAPPKRGRGRGRGKRKNEAIDIPAKKPRVEQEFIGIEHNAKPVITLEKLPVDTNSSMKNSPELFRALNQPILNQIAQQPREVEIIPMTESAKASSECEVMKMSDRSTSAVQEGGMEVIKIPSRRQVTSMHLSSDSHMVQAPILDDKGAVIIKVTRDEQGKQSDAVDNGKEAIQSTQNWLAPSIKKVTGDALSRNETISSLTVIDEETRMSAESSSRSQTPARNMSAPVDTLVNEESQNSVLSTATTESEKVKQPKNRRMEISFDPDEGPFTVDKIAEYEWPSSDKINELKPVGSRGETFMIQEQISQYLGVKSFKRKYPDLKRRMVDMEERNFLRENALVSESMCDMGLTAVSSSEVLDIMCSDFPEQYEEYRKHMREKAAKEHSKKQKELSAAANAERNRIDLAEMAMQSAISWNSGFNKARQESRRCSLDLQTFTIHMPRRPPKYDPFRRGSNYPCALITGQYTDYFREYKPAELRYYPLNTVVYGPTRPNERKFDSQSEGSQSDSDSDSSSDDSSSTSSEGTQDTEGSQSTMDEVDMELTLDPSIKCKMCSNHLNKNNRPETLIVCGTCNGNVHPSCIELTLDMVPHIRAYAWQCTDCKTCAQCHDPADEDKMLFCDMCDRGYHIYCVGLRRVPQGRWHCQECAVCANCGSKEPGGANSDRNSVAQWQHEFKKGDKNTRVYVSTFCVPCSKLWRKGRYCPHCSRCHNATRLDQEPNLVHCGACDKYLHLECVETKGMTIDRRNYLCEFCSPNRQHLVKPLTSKTFKT